MKNEQLRSIDPGGRMIRWSECEGELSLPFSGISVFGTMWSTLDELLSERDELMLSEGLDELLSERDELLSDTILFVRRVIT